MKHRLAGLALLALGLLCTLPFVPASSQQAPDPNNTLVIELKTGRVLIKMRPDRFTDIIATNALYRPGPLNGGMVDEFVDVKNGRKQAVYLHPMLKDVL